MECLAVAPVGRRNPVGICAAIVLFVTSLLAAPHAQARVELQPCKNSIAPQQQVSVVGSQFSVMKVVILALSAAKRKDLLFL
jgi:hypothetical protein